MNWLDWLILVFVGLSIAGGYKEGIIRMGIGLVALVVAFFAASWFSGPVAGWFAPYAHSRPLSSILGFVVVFVGVILAGAVIGLVVQRVFKLVGLSFVDRLLGAGFGFVRAVVVVAVGTMVLMAFAPKRVPSAFTTSVLAPYVMSTTRVISAATPYELKHGVERTYAELRDFFDDVTAKKRKLPVREE